MNDLRKNAVTFLMEDVRRRPSPELFEEAFESVRVDVARLTADLEPGFVVAVCTPGRSGSVIRRFTVDPGGKVEPVVVGRHEQSDVVVTSDAAVSLRHVLLLFGVDGMHRSLVRVLDLRSPTGTVDARGVAHYSLAANGPLALRIAESALFVIPTDGKPIGDFGAVPWTESVPWIPDEPAEQRLCEVSGIARAPSAVSAVTRGTGLGRPIVRRKGGKRSGLLKLEAGETTFEFPVGLPSLRAGVLVGRYDRCDLSSQIVEMPETVSRVHVLVIAFDECPHVFDVGSTNGLSYESFPIRGMALPPHQPSTLTLAPEVRLTWWPG
ncbi:MAG: hypothetical protein PHU25_21440 [Deltaproteobacteria bacterium]|nr:hypothetical protein [Deltaproteobacteria bacterium]